MTRITIEVEETQKKQLKVLAALNNMTMKELILDRTIGLDPNSETLQSFSDYEKGENLTTHNNFKKLIEDLDN